MLQKINFFTDVNDESQISDIINYGNVSFKKPSIRLSIVVEDEYGNEALQDYEVKIYNIDNIVFNSDETCTFNVKSLTTNNNLKIRLEIIDSNTRLFGVSEYIDFNTSNSNTVSISFKNFDIRNNSEIYYRFLIEDKSLNIKDYYPSANGSNDVSTFSIIKNLVNTKLKSAVYPIGYDKKELDIEQDIVSKLLKKNPEDPEEIINPEDPEVQKKIKKLLDIYTNPSEYQTIDLTKKDEDGKYEYEKHYKANPLNNYGHKIEGLVGKTLEFNIPEINHLTFERYKFRLFSNGEKILEDKYKCQNSYDGLGKLYVSDTLINKNSNIEIQSIKNLINETERFNYVIEITDMDQITKLHNEGLIIDKFFYDPALLTCHVMREVENSGSYRINLNRFYIRQYNDEQLRITILDPLYAPGEISLKRNIYDDTEFKNPLFDGCKNGIIKDKKDDELHAEILAEGLTDEEDIKKYVEDNEYRIRKGNPVLEDYKIKIGDKLYITSDIIYEREVLKSNTTAINDGTISYLKPTFFIPFSFITINNNIITDLSSVTNQTEIFINGKCAVPGDDYTIISNNEDLNLPSLILFKNLLFSNTTIEIIFNGTTISKSYYPYVNPNNTDFIFDFSSDKNFPHPLIDGCYDVYSNNYKVPNSIIKTLSKNKFCILNDNITRNISPQNIYIKFNFSNNKIIETLLNSYESMSETEISTSGLNILNINATNDSKGIQFAEFIWDLDENNKEVVQLKNIYNSLEAENHANILNCKESNISGNDFITNNINIPYLFNHKINIHSFSYLTQENFRDNISILNPSRILQINDMSKESFNCNTDKYPYDIFLNEEIPINVDYINEDIEIDCNKVFK